MATTITIGAEFPSISPTVHNDVVNSPPPAYDLAQQPQPAPTPVTMPYMAQTTTNNVVLERVVQQQPTAQPQIIYVNAQPQKQEEKKQQSELQQVVGFCCALVWGFTAAILCPCCCVLA